MIDYRSHSFRRYFANTSWLVGEKITRIFVSFFVGILLARYLGPERFGLLSYALSFVALFATITTLGLDEIVVRKLVEGNVPKEELLGTSFLLRLFAALLSIVSIYVFSRIISPDAYTRALILIVAAGTLFQPLNVIDFYFQAQVLGRFTSIAQFLSLFLSSALRVILILSGASLSAFAWAVLIETGLLSISLLIIYKKRGYRIRDWRFRKNIALDLLGKSWPLLISGMAIMIYMRIDQLMIKEMLDDEALGNYAVAVKLVETFYFIPLAICSSLFPAILSAKASGAKTYQDRLQSLYDLMASISIIIALPTALLSDYVIAVLLGDQYHMAANVVRIYIWAGIFVFLGVASGKWLLAENLQQYSLSRTVIGALINIGLNLILIPRIGIYGAALATLLSYFTAGYLSLALFKRSRQAFWMMTKSLNPIAANRRLFNV